MRRRAKVDINQPDIVNAFRLLGYSVLHLHTVGAGCPDIAVGKRGTTWLVEIKNGSLSPSQRRLTQPEEVFWQEWLGSLLLIESVNDVLEFDRKHFGRR